MTVSPMAPRKPTGVDINPILDAIDHCLTDWAVSPDAMRWTPTPQAERSTGIALPAGTTDYEPPDTRQWMTLGYTTTVLEMRYFLNNWTPNATP